MTPQRQLLYWLGGLGVFVLLLWALSDILAPFLIGMAVAYFLDPLCDRMERIGLSRTLATTVVTLVFVVVVGLIVMVVVPLVAGELVELAQQIPGYVELLRHRLVELSQTMRTELDPALLDQIRNAIVGSQDRITSWAVGLARNLLSGGVAVFNVVALLLITPIVAFYLLRDWDRLIAQADRLLPPAYAEVIREQARAVDRTLAGFIRGVGTVCLFLGAFYATGLTLVGLDFGLVIGVSAGLISFIPYVGATLGAIASIGLAFLQFDGYLMPAIVAGIFFAGQFIEGNILQPTLVGDRVGLHPVWVIFALLAGGALLGFVGVLIAVPGAAVIGVGVRFFVGQYREKVLGQSGAAGPAAAGPGAEDP